MFRRFKLKNLLKLRSQNDIEFHVEEVIKRADKINIKSKVFSLPDFDTLKKRNTYGTKGADYHDLVDLLFRMKLLYDEIKDVLDSKYFPSTRQVIPYQLECMKEAILTKS